MKPTNPAGSAKPPPTRKQLAYLRSLANRSGTTFTYPRTSSQASAEIKRLQRLGQSSQADRTREQPWRRSSSAAPDLDDSLH